VQQPEKKSGSFFNFGATSENSAFKRLQRNAESNPASRSAGTAASADSANQVAAVEPQPAPQPESAPVPAPVPDQPQTASLGEQGYVAQLASFRSEAEALAEFDRLKAKHPAILGGQSSRVSKGSAGGITRYRLGVGPMADKAAADNICNQLIAAGERDCIAKHL
jgi:cell division protein FtsN